MSARTKERTENGSASQRKAKRMNEVGTSILKQMDALTERRLALEKELTENETQFRALRGRFDAFSCAFVTEGGSPCRERNGFAPAVVTEIVSYLPCCEHHAKVRRDSIYGPPHLRGPGRNDAPKGPSIFDPKP